MPKPVSLTMIVRNESANLPACLQSVAGLFAETVIVDTGSTDETRAIAESFGSRVFDFAWCDDFSAARNFTLDKVTTDWLFWLDADDRVDEINRPKLRELLASCDGAPCVYRMPVVSFFDAGHFAAFKHARLFHLGTRPRWSGRVHESLSFAEGTEVRECDVSITHIGYLDADHREASLTRNVRLLMLEIRENPSNPAPFYFLGLELEKRGNVELALRAYRGGQSLIVDRSGALASLLDEGAFRLSVLSSASIVA
jgi:glycosyltransferase involved in cell wall biosynthesis